VFELSYERHHKVLRSRFSGLFEPRDLAALDAVVRRFVAEHGPVRGLMDFSDTTFVAVPETLLAARSRLPQISPGQHRVIVAPADAAFALAQAYASSQRDHGNVEITVVRTAAEAHAALGLVDPVFETLA
jgi:hypothetical protein